MKPVTHYLPSVIRFRLSGTTNAGTVGFIAVSLHISSHLRQYGSRTGDIDCQLTEDLGSARICAGHAITKTDMLVSLNGCNFGMCRLIQEARPAAFETSTLSVPGGPLWAYLTLNTLRPDITLCRHKIPEVGIWRKIGRSRCVPL